MNDLQRLKKDYPWIQTPLVIGAPMRLIALADMAAEISKAGTFTSSSRVWNYEAQHVHLVFTTPLSSLRHTHFSF